ncbi:transglutaminase domain-containing protein [Ammonifex thiophilus]|uniref:Transglutaminase domain-containing protein n=1 Tax=Ammonifex thiophilus TaxID=444093 RepID=A0A3D8P431_9THEO|nr:transglutaminase domain-containing protein [Ammonifex thiophilus]RDV81818.1 hypothetical protein DXX99_08530 [Ammonifex thiophilus]
MMVMKRKRKFLLATLLLIFLAVPQSRAGGQELVSLSSLLASAGVPAEQTWIGEDEVLVFRSDGLLLRIAAGSPYLLAVIPDRASVTESIYTFTVGGTRLTVTLPRKAGGERLTRVELPFSPRREGREMLVPATAVARFLSTATPEPKGETPSAPFREYTWHYRGEKWEWRLSIPTELYRRFARRPLDYYAWYHGCLPYAEEGLNRELVRALAQVLEKVAPADPWGRVEFVTAFVQEAIPYVPGVYRYYPQYPVETLLDGGDCKGKAVLLASLLREMGYDTALVLVDLGNRGHLAVGVKCSAAPPHCYHLPGSAYVYLESTAPAWPAGTVPPFYAQAPARFFPLS